MKEFMNRKMAAAGAMLTTAAMAPQFAFAGELATAFEGGVDKAELSAIGVVVLAVCGIVFLIRSARRTA
ncbi:hypothetical protein CO615_09760 [Lysobacteraceae bacterium NML75-0749]|nr:hypothetical protein CO615_09760 [Xanthomonadaceae bacterium NML75-0749]